MKKFKFRLEAILKLKKMEEEKVKMDIGKIQFQINTREQQVAIEHQEIELAYSTHQAELAKGLKGDEITFHPYFVEGKKKKIGILENEIKELNTKKEELLVKLGQARAQTKVYSEMKDKEKSKYRKEINKKQEENIEESVRMWNYQRVKNA